MRRLAPALVVALLFVVAVIVLGSRQGPGQPPAARPVRAGTAPPPQEVATRFLVDLSLPVMLDARRRDAVIARYAATRALRPMQKEYANEAARLRAALTAQPRLARTALLGHREARLRSGDTTVDIWAVTIGGAGDSPVSIGWRLLRVHTVLERGVWKVESVRERPAPPMQGTASALARSAMDLKEYRLAP
jgi:hypothetical protein